MRPLVWSVLVLPMLPACVMVPAGGSGSYCQDEQVAAAYPHSAQQVQGRWRAYGSVYSSPDGGYDNAVIYWEGAPPPPGTHIERGPFRRRRDMPVLVVGNGRAPASGPVLTINHNGVQPRRRPCR